MNHKHIQDSIRTELESTRDSFHAILASLSEEDLHKQSLNPGWTNVEILAHMLFGFIVTVVLLPMTRIWGKLPNGSSKPFAWLLNALTVPFNWVNAIGARMQGKVFTHKRLGKLFDRFHASLLKTAASIKEDEWQRGMYYPTKWDANFSEFMTIEKLYHYPVVHFNFHLDQISH
ncbi:MAG: DinB family protein [Anaerolineales bacterium]|nr:DinB family protein [Anaerolineales bacterium]